MSTELIPGLEPFLMANAALNAAAGGVIVQDFLSDGKSVGISFTLVSDTQRTTFQGTAPHKMRVQFQFQAVTAAAQNTMAAALYTLLAGFQGQLPNGVFLTGAVYITGRGGRSEATEQHAATADYYFFFN